MRAIDTFAQVVREQAQGTVKVVETVVGLRLAPSGLRRNPDVDDIFFCRLGKMNFNHRGERGLRCG